MLLLCLGLYGFLFGKKAEQLSVLQKSQQAVNNASILIKVTSDIEQDLKSVEDTITKAIPNTFVVQDMRFDSDIAFTTQEFFYLVGIKPGDRIGAHELQRAVSMLLKKNKFETIKLAICPCEEIISENNAKVVEHVLRDVTGVHTHNRSMAGRGIDADESKYVHMTLTGAWTFKMVKVHGIWVGGYEYAKQYAMEPGDLFSNQKHEHSLGKIVDVLHQQGYFDSRVSSELHQDTDTKSVLVDLFIDRGPKFSVGDVDFIVKAAKSEKIEKLDGVQKRVQALFKKKFVSSAYSKAMINRETRGIKRYFSQKGFLHVDIELVEKIDREKNNVDLQFTITVHSKKEFIFFGNNFFSREQLLEKILMYGRSAWLVPSAILSGEIAKEYRAHGFWDVRVKTREEERGCFFLITEGSRAVIHDIECIGIQHFETEFLRKNCFSAFLKAHYFDQKLLEKSLDTLLSLYLRAGFWDVKLLKHDFVAHGDGHDVFEKPGDLSDNVSAVADGLMRYTLVVSVDEGEQRFLQGISIEGLQSLEEQAVPEGADAYKQFVCKQGVLDEILQQEPFAEYTTRLLSQGESCKIPFDIDIISKQKNWLVHYCKQKGYLHVQVTPELTYKKQAVWLQWVVNLEQVITFGKTVVLGNRTGELDYIMRELQYAQGQVWDNEKLKQSITRLRSLGIFEHAHLYPYRFDIAESQKDILLKLHNADPYEIRTRIGLARYGIDKHCIFGQGFTYKIGGAFFWKNPLQAADQFATEFDVASTYRNVRARYSRPWMFGVPVKTIFKIYANRYEQPGFICSKKNLYEAKQDGFLVGFNRMYRRVDFSVNIGAEWMATIAKKNMLRHINAISQVIDFDCALLGKKIPYLLIEPTVLINTVDDKLNPRSGFFTLVTLKGMFPLQKKFSCSYFVKLMAEQSVFYSPMPKFVLAARLRFGHMFRKKFRSISPIERFYLGGAHSIRGYEKDMCPPWGMLYDTNKEFAEDAKVYDFVAQESDCQDYGESDGAAAEKVKRGNLLVVAPIGGKTMMNCNIEARVDLYGSISGVVFQDVGALIGDRFDSACVSAATGIGLRFNTIVGPIRFDVARKWKVRKPFESRYAWFLAFGNAF